jgi:hypothetical protein
MAQCKQRKQRKHFTFGKLGVLCSLAGLLASCAHPPKPAPHPGASPTPPAPRTTASPTGPYGFIYTPPSPGAIDPASPQIKEIDLNDHVLTAPGPVRVRVYTSLAVTSVIVRTMGHELAVPQLSPGIFGADDQLPNIPFFLRRRTFDVDFIAAGRDGHTTDITLPITLR